MRYRNICLNVTLFTFLIVGVFPVASANNANDKPLFADHSPAEPRVITSTENRAWVKENCKKLEIPKAKKSMTDSRYEKFRCQNSVQLNLYNRDETLQTVKLDEDEVTIKYKIEISLPGEDSDYYFNSVGNDELFATLTHFGPNKDFITSIGAHNFKNIHVCSNPGLGSCTDDGEWIKSESYTGYELKKPIGHKLSYQSDRKVLYQARITVKATDEVIANLKKLNIFSSFARLRYRDSVDVWLSAPQMDSVKTEEGVTVRLDESNPPFHVAGELEAGLYASKVRNQARIELWQTRYNPGKDTHAAVYLKSYSNIATNDKHHFKPAKNLKIGEGVYLTGEGTFLKHVDHEPLILEDFDCRSHNFKGKISYRVKHGRMGQKPDYESSIEEIVLRNPAFSNRYEDSSCE